MIDTLTQRHLLPMVAPAAILRCVGGVDLDKLPASFFRFARQLREKGRPCRITDAFCQTMIMNHAVHMQVFHCNQTKPINNLTAFLMREIVTSKGDTLMHTRNDLAMLAPFRCAFCQLLMLAFDSTNRTIVKGQAVPNPSARRERGLSAPL
jgi:hypothetical protein